VQSRDSAAFADTATQLCMRLLEDGEPRVRLAVGRCLGALAARRGLAAWEAVRGAVLGSIERCWVRAGSACCRIVCGPSPARPSKSLAPDFLSELLLHR
jgi:hypothetical protein